MAIFSSRVVANIGCILAIASTTLSSSTGGYSGAPIAVIENGVVIGTTTSLPAATATVNKFLGIPFAQSPPDRFSPPSQAPQMKTINATAWKPACIQQFVYPLLAQEFTELVFNNPPPEESEDCLYLNVYAPSTPSNNLNGRTVMFWIYGGSLQFGNAGQPIYDGSHFAAYEDVIVVTTNYRTNVFGFPSSPELPLTGHNLGFLDQRFALEWVQRNIRAFGGDPDKVTVFGESAGAFSIDCLLTSYPKNSTPPFRGAILESGQYSYRPTPAVSSVPAWYNLTAELGCPGSYDSNLTCVRAANATTIKQIIDVNILEFNPIPDNVTLVSFPAQQRLSGNIANIPTLQGTNAQEGRVFTVGDNNITAYIDAAFGSVPALVAEIIDAYPLGIDGLNTPYEVIAQIFTDWVFQCPCALNTNATASIGIPAWRYYFNASFANTQAYPNLGVFHSSEIPIVYSTYAAINATTREYALSNFMRGTWARFAKNPRAGPGWNAVGTGAAGPVLFGDGSAVGGVYISANGSVEVGDWDVAILGNVGAVMGSGATVVAQSELDAKCAIFAPVYAANDLQPALSF